MRHYGWPNVDEGDHPKRFGYLNESARGREIIRHVKNTAIVFKGVDVRREYPTSLECEVENPYVSIASAPMPMRDLSISSLGKEASFTVVGFGFVHTEKNGRPKNEYEVLRGYLSSNDPYIEELIDKNQTSENGNSEKQIPVYMVTSHIKNPGELNFSKIKFTNYRDTHSFDGVCSLIMDDGAILSSKEDVDNFAHKLKIAEHDGDTNETTFENLGEKIKFDPKSAEEAREKALQAKK